MHDPDFERGNPGASLALSLNKTGAVLHIHVAASVALGTGSISDFVWEERASGDWGGDACCIAAAQLAQDFPNSGAVVNLTTSEQSIWSKSGTDTELIQAVLQFKVTSAQPTELRLRIVASSSGAIAGSWADPMALLTLSKHIRGLWPWSTLNLFSGAFDANPAVGPPHYYELGVCEHSGPEHQSWSYAVPAGHESEWTADIGCYGANLFYRFHLINSGALNFPIYAFASARRDALDKTGRPAKYRGAVWVYQPTGYARRIINSIVAPNPPGGLSPSWVMLTSAPDESPLPVIVPAGGELELIIAVANAGSSTLPFNLIVSRLPEVPT